MPASTRDPMDTPPVTPVAVGDILPLRDRPSTSRGLPILPLAVESQAAREVSPPYSPEARPLPLYDPQARAFTTPHAGTRAGLRTRTRPSSCDAPLFPPTTLPLPEDRLAREILLLEHLEGVDEAIRSRMLATLYSQNWEESGGGGGVEGERGSKEEVSRTSGEAGGGSRRSPYQQYEW